MDDMNETQEPTTELPSGPRVKRDEVFDIERLRRSSTDKYVAGVSGGLGRHFDIDPLIVRVVFAVAALFGVGVLLYVALWLIVPDDTDQVPVRTAPETRKVLVLVAGGLAAAMLVGAVLGDSWGIFPLAILGLAAIAVYAAVNNKPEQQGPASPAGPADPIHAQRYVPPRRPKRTGMILFWPTLAVLAIALGFLAIHDIDNPVSQGAYAALSLAIIGTALVIGAFAGRAGGLILLGLLALPPLLVTSTIGNDFTSTTGQVTERPTLASQVQDEYDVRAGQLRLDLSRLAPSELAQLDGREIDIDMTAGDVVVTLPEGAGFSVEASLLAGEIRVLDRISNGVNPELHSTSPARAGEPTINLDIDGSVGHVEVNQEGPVR